jgi:hypothetical protein
VNTMLWVAEENLTSQRAGNEGLKQLKMDVQEDGDGSCS